MLFLKNNIKKNFFYLFIIFFLIFIFIVFFRGLNKENVYVPSEIFNSEIINFSSKELFTNEEIIFKELLSENKFTILNIWASWCLPCRSEHKYLMQLSNNKDLNIIGLNYKDKIQNAKNFIDDFGNPYSVVLVDSDGTKSIELGAYGVPETYIINNEKKKFLKKYIGPIDQYKFNEIKKIILK